MKLDNIVEAFISKIVYNDHDLEDSEIITFLVEKGNSKTTSVYVTLFTPIVLGRIICKDLEVNFTDIFIEHLQDGTERKGEFKKNHFYTEIYNAVKIITQNNVIDSDNILKIALRSPEFKILNDFMQNNNKINEIQFSPLHINL